MGADSARDRIATARVNGDFRFTDREWKSILESLGRAQIDLAVRPKLERAASQFLRGHPDWFKPSKDQKRVLRVTAKSAKLLLENLDHLPERLSRSLRTFTMVGRIAAVMPSPGVIDEEDIDRLWAELKRDLARLVRAAEGISSPPRHPPNVDSNRNKTWYVAGEIYEQVTGDTVGVSEPSDVGTSEGGPFFRFVSAFMKAIPGADVPTRGQVRGWYRGPWKARQARRASMASKY